MNSGTELHEQNGVMAPKVEASRYSPPKSLLRERKLRMRSIGK